ncbi:MAG: transcription antitermination factor NusB [Clostridia bacterium]|nr:transcription antitermination factor NusB [Clostridia bacterium]
MSRKIAREIAVHMVYEYGYQCNTASEILEERLNPEFLSTLDDDLILYRDFANEQMGYVNDVVGGVVVHEEEIDDLIQKYSIGWNIKRISRIARAILRVAIFEIKFYDDVPTGVAINEAVELTKRYDTKETSAFVNGILGKVARGE